MPKINELSAVDEVVGSDLLPVWKTGDSDTRKASVNQLNTYIAAQSDKQDKAVTQYEAPTAGTTVSMTDTGDNAWLILKPFNTLATLTIKFPLLSNCVHGQEALINCTQIVTTLTWNGNGASVAGQPTTFAALFGYARFQFDGVLSAWYRTG